MNEIIKKEKKNAPSEWISNHCVLPHPPTYNSYNNREYNSMQGNRAKQGGRLSLVQCIELAHYRTL